MYRKSREDIAEWLPEMIEKEVPVRLDPAMMGLHDLVKQDLSDAIDKALAEGVRGSFDVLAHYGRTPERSGHLTDGGGDVPTAGNAHAQQPPGAAQHLGKGL